MPIRLPSHPLQAEHVPYPRISVAVMLLAINLIVIFLFTLILALISGNQFFDELAYLFTYTMCSDGIYDFVNNQEDVLCFIVKIVLTIIQMVIFSGALIGYFPQDTNTPLFFCDGMDKENHISIRPKDNLILVAYES